MAKPQLSLVIPQSEQMSWLVADGSARTQHAEALELQELDFLVARVARQCLLSSVKGPLCGWPILLTLDADSWTLSVQRSLIGSNSAGLFDFSLCCTQWRCIATSR